MTQNEDVESIDEDGIDVDEGESERVELTLKIPTNTDEEDEFIVYVRAEAENDLEHCNEESVSIKIKRDRHKVVVEEFVLSPYTIKCGQDITADVWIKNIGKKDEDVKVVLESPELHIFEETLEFELETDRKDESLFKVRIPEGIEAGEYNIRARVMFDGEYEEETRELIVVCPKIKVDETGKDKIIKLNGDKVQKQDDLYGILNIILLVGIIALFLGIIIALIVRK